MEGRGPDSFFSGSFASLPMTFLGHRSSSTFSLIVLCFWAQECSPRALTLTGSGPQQASFIDFYFFGSALSKDGLSRSAGRQRKRFPRPVAQASGRCQRGKGAWWLWEFGNQTPASETPLLHPSHPHPKGQVSRGTIRSAIPAYEQEGTASCVSSLGKCTPHPTLPPRPLSQ